MSEQHLDVLVIGAGLSGVCAAIRLRKAGTTNFLVIDKDHGIGGTWFQNTYPGAACDVPSHVYSYSFAPNPDWSRTYAPQAEIQAYIERCVDEFGVRDHIQLGRHVDRLRFDDQRGLWEASFADGSIEVARHVINASGGLHHPNIPDFPGRDSFGGPTMHTARWDHDVDLAGRRVAVIGAAASAIQVIPEVAKVAAHVTVFQRTPNYIAPREDAAYSDDDKRRFKQVPLARRLHRWQQMVRQQRELYPIVVDPEPRREKAELVKMFMKFSVQDPALHDALEPDYEMGCKRILISDDFYATLNEPHVDLVAGGVTRITPTGIVDAQGVEHDVDVIIYATGFDIQAQSFGIEVIGRDGVELRDVWADRVAAHRGVMIPGFPNYHLVTGPNTGVGTFSVVFMVEVAVRWILKCISMAGDRWLVEPRPEAFATWNADIQTALGDTVWSSGCDSWYRNAADGAIETLYPHDAITWWRQMRRVRRSELIRTPAPKPQKQAVDA